VKTVWAYDIASAYPYQLARLPCMQHGRWKHFPKGGWPAKDLVSLLRYRIDPSSRSCPAWGPLPHRLLDGNIVFPRVSAGGWAWSAEVFAARKFHPGIRILEAWVWCPTKKCAEKHPPPYRNLFVELYKRRLYWGKERRGMVLRLGMNSVYGKSAQRAGQPRYRCQVRAGLITSMTRAMLLEAILCARDPWNVVELATDSVMSLEPLTLPQPEKLGTEEAARKAGKVPMGGWEEKEWEGGAMLLRPGLRFPILPEGKEKQTAARGVGTRVLHQNRAALLQKWREKSMAPVTVQQPTFFWGAKSSIRRVQGEPDILGDREWFYVRDPKYGRWEEPPPRKLQYSPHPKRESLLEGFRLDPWCLPQDAGSASLPYDVELVSAIARELEELRILEEEQPEMGLSDAI
jgi:hypothetical protein